MNVVLRMEPYDPDAQDGDGDGIVQERTPWERPAGTVLLNDIGIPIPAGQNSPVRPDGMQVVDRNGNKIRYVPSYAGRTPSKDSAGPKSSLSDHGALSLRERGLPTIGEMAVSSRQPPPAPPESSDDQVTRNVLQRLLQYLKGNRPDKSAKENDVRQFLGEALESINNFDARASREEVQSALQAAGRIFLWENGLRNNKNNLKSDGSLDFDKILSRLNDFDVDDPEAKLLEDLYAEGGISLIAPALETLSSDITTTQMRNLAQTLALRFRSRDVEPGELDDPEWMASALSSVLSDLKKKKNPKEDSLAGVNEVIEQTATKAPFDRTKSILTREFARGRQDLLEDSALDGSVERFPKAEEFLNEGGEVDQVPAPALASAMFDGNLYNIDGDPVDIKEIMTDSTWYQNPSINVENERFEFSLIKNDQDVLGGIWAVWKARDKDTGREYFVKLSQYGTHDALLETIGEDVQALLGFTFMPEQRMINPQGSESLIMDRNSDPTRPELRGGRWMVVPHVGDLVDADVLTDEVELVKNLKRIAKDAGISPKNDEGLQKQIGRIAVMDFILDNQDRHSGNLMFFVDPSTGAIRLVPIDHGLMFGGRATESDSDAPLWGDDDWGDYADKRLGVQPHPGGIDQVMRFQDAINTDNPMPRLVGAHQAVDELSAIDFDELFSPERLEKQGIKLSDEEKSHLAAMKKFAKGRMEILSNDRRLIGELFSDIGPNAPETVSDSANAPEIDYDDDYVLAKRAINPAIIGVGEVDSEEWGSDGAARIADQAAQVGKQLDSVNQDDVLLLDEGPTGVRGWLKQVFSEDGEAPKYRTKVSEAGKKLIADTQNVGKSIREEVARRIKKSRPDLLEKQQDVEKRRLELVEEMEQIKPRMESAGKALNDAKTWFRLEESEWGKMSPDERVRWIDEMIERDSEGLGQVGERMQKQIQQELAKHRDVYLTFRKTSLMEQEILAVREELGDLFLETMSEVRDFGGTIRLGQVEGDEEFRGQVEESMAEVSRFYPSDWIENTPVFDVVRRVRGFFSERKNQMGLLTEEQIRDGENLTRLVLHEYAHAAGVGTNKVRLLERIFLASRTEKDRYVTTGPDEWALPDEFPIAYMGRIYGEGDRMETEILAIGMEFMFGSDQRGAGSTSLIPVLPSEDIVDFVLGTLVSAGRS